MVNLKTARKDAGLTQVEIAQRINVSQQCYSDYENGKTDPDMNTLVMIADILQVSTDYLLGRTDELGAVITPFPPSDDYTDEEKKLIADYRELTPPLKRMIQETLKTWKSSEINTKKLS